MEVIKRLYDFVVNLIFPRKCPFCNDVIKKGYMCCVECAPKLPFIDEDRCGLCGMSTETCSCKRKARNYKKIVAPFIYAEPVNRGIWKLKYRGYKDVCVTLSKYMAQAAAEHLDLERISYIIPVPMHKDKSRKRGYNQSALLAQQLETQLEIKYLPDVLVRDIKGKEQHSLSFKNRQGNVRGIYTVKNGEKLKDKSVLLVDDVLTTGATLGECAKILKIFGAKEVFCLIIAVTDIAKD